MNKIQSVLAINIKEYRYNLKYSQMRLAEIANVSTSLIASIETGVRFPSSNTLQKISQALGVKPYQLFLDKEEKTLESEHERIVKLLSDLKSDISGILEKDFNDFLLGK